MCVCLLCQQGCLPYGEAPLPRRATDVLQGDQYSNGGCVLERREIRGRPAEMKTKTKKHKNTKNENGSINTEAHQIHSIQQLGTVRPTAAGDLPPLGTDCGLAAALAPSCQV